MNPNQWSRVTVAGSCPINPSEPVASRVTEAPGSAGPPSGLRVHRHTRVSPPTTSPAPSPTSPVSRGALLLFWSPFIPPDPGAPPPRRQSALLGASRPLRRGDLLAPRHRDHSRDDPSRAAARMTFARPSSRSSYFRPRCANAITTVVITRKLEDL